MPRWTQPALTVIGAVLTAFAALRIVTYPFNVHMPLFFGDVPMAFTTACAFLLVGLGFLVMVRVPNGD